MAAQIGPFTLAERDAGAIFTRVGEGAVPGGLVLHEGGLEWWGAPGLLYAVAPALPEEVTDQTDGWLWLEIAAPTAALEALFARLCDVDLPVLEAPWSARTVIEHHGVWLLAPEAGRVVVLGPRSTAQSLARAVMDAARSVTAQGVV
jgi:sarcosine oxidase gamma subunit